MASLERSTLAAAAIAALAAALGACKDDKPVSDADARQLFSTTCARCHGPEGTGGPPAAAGAPSPRNFHDAEFQKSRSDADIVRTITGGKPPGMPAFGGTLTEGQIQGVMHVVRSFDPAKAGAEKK